MALALLPVELLEPAGEALAAHRDLHDAADALVRLQAQAQRAGARRAARLDAPQAAVEQALAPVVAQADQLVIRLRQRIDKSAPLAQPRIVGAARGIAADQRLDSGEHARRVERRLAHHLALAVAAGLE